ncbi:hypothetical protein [Pseudoalteromonas phage J2-1_QLiu-2017]|nr:hypothetical protein [Pseudoalteromonas phage J2-1_QLiu-2017]
MFVYLFGAIVSIVLFVVMTSVRVKELDNAILSDKDDVIFGSLALFFVGLFSWVGVFAQVFWLYAMED